MRSRSPVPHLTLFLAVFLRPTNQFDKERPAFTVYGSCRTPFSRRVFCFLVSPRERLLRKLEAQQEMTIVESKSTGGRTLFILFTVRDPPFSRSFSPRRRGILRIFPPPPPPLSLISLASSRRYSFYVHLVLCFFPVSCSTVI